MIFGLPGALAGTIIAAVIAAIVSLLGLIISKETKVSEFRQAWIDSLRAEIAAVITHAQALHGAHLANSKTNRLYGRMCAMILLASTKHGQRLSFA